MHKFYRKEKEATNRIICFFAKGKEERHCFNFFSLILKME